MLKGKHKLQNGYMPFISSFKIHKNYALLYMFNMYNKSMSKYIGILDIKLIYPGMTAGREAGEKDEIGEGCMEVSKWNFFKAQWQVQGFSFLIPCCTP